MHNAFFGLKPERIPGSPGVATRVYPYPGYCASPIEVTQVPGKGMGILQNSQNFRVLWHGRTELTQVSGRYKNAVPISRVFVAWA